VSTREQAVTDGVGDRGLAESLVPERDRELARDDRAAHARPILDHFQQVSCLGVGERLEGEVVEDEDVDPGPGSEEAGQASVEARRGELGEEAWHPQVERAVPGPDGGTGKRAGEIRLADPRGPGEPSGVSWRP
jgi:hypothetical protein